MGGGLVIRLDITTPIYTIPLLFCYKNTDDSNDNHDDTIHIISLFHARNIYVYPLKPGIFFTIWAKLKVPVHFNQLAKIASAPPPPMLHT